MGRFSGSILGVCILAGFASAQFGSPPPAAAPSALVPAAQSATPQPPSAHPWYVKPEYGQWMICVKSYGGKNARVSAEALATEIRERYPTVPTWLFERGATEREQERQRHQQELAKKHAELAQEEAAFNAIQAQAKADALAKGMDFIESRPQIKAGTVNYDEQYAVLIGGWPTMEAARKELEKIRRWEPPSNKSLMDGQMVAISKDGSGVAEQQFINPFKTAMVVANPVAPRTPDPESEVLTKYVLKLNADEPYSVLKIKKNWTIAVKQFTPPIQVRGKEEKSFITRLFNPPPEPMAATVSQARNMATALREMKPTEKFPYGPFESYLLHTKYGTLLCVGQFDGPEDPKLIEIQNQLGLMKFNVKVKEGDKLHLADEKEVRLFDHLYAMKVH